MAERNEQGKFVKGNTQWKKSPVTGSANPHSANLQKFRALFYNKMTKKDFEEVFDILLAHAKNGDKWAVEQIMDRCLGKASQPIEGDISGVQKIIVEYVKPGQESNEED